MKEKPIRGSQKQPDHIFISIADDAKTTMNVTWRTCTDIEKGYVEVANRKGVIEQFPLTAISIGVVEADKGRFANMLEIGEIGAQVKHLAKSVMGSSYSIDRRKNPKK